MTATVNHTLHRVWAADLDTATLYELLRLRVDVFVVEQGAPYRELDGRDLLPDTRHIWLESDGLAICTLRLREQHAPESEFYIERVCTAAEFRRQGHTRRVVEAALAEVGAMPCRVNAQSYVSGLYARYGFVQDGAEYVEEGIPHTPLRRAGH